jgi:hypothetical protein
VSKNLLDHCFFVNKRNNLHRTAAVRTFQRIDFINTPNKRSPIHAALFAKSGIRFRLSGQQAQPAFLSSLPFLAVVTSFCYVRKWTDIFLPVSQDLLPLKELFVEIRVKKESEVEIWLDDVYAR